MSIPVELEGLAAKITDRGLPPFLLTTAPDAKPHAVAISPGWDGGRLVGPCGRSSARNIGTHPDVTLLWPPDAPGEYSLIVDGTATVHGDGDDRTVAIAPVKAVLHRPAPEPDPGADCLHDCVKVLDEPG